MSWPLVPLAEALSDSPVFVDGDWVESKDQDPDGDVRLIQLADVGDGFFIDKSSRFLTSEKAKQLRCTFLEPGDVLVARMPDPLGRACIFPGSTQKSITVVDVCIIRPNPNRVDGRYLMHCINGPNVRHDIQRQATGTTRQRISRGNLKSVSIPLPPLAEQRRIAAILDQAEELRAKRRAAIALLDQLPQAIFLDMFGDPVANPMKWQTMTVKEIGRVVTGNTPPRSREDYYGAGIDWVKTDNLLEDAYYVSTSTEQLTKAGRAAGRVAPEGSLLVACIAGSRASIGRAAVNEKEVAFNQQMNAIIPACANVCFLYYLLNVGKHIIQMASTDSMKGMVSKSKLEGVVLPVPPIDLQDQFATRVEEGFRVKSTNIAALDELDHLFASLQQVSFGPRRSP